MLAEDRYKTIMQIIEKDGSVKVSFLSNFFKLSDETIRRDLEHLENQGYLKRVYGGAILEKKVSSASKLPQITTFLDREYIRLKEKQEIAKSALSLIKEGQSVALDAGTTTYEAAKLMKDTFKRLTIITNSLMIANELSNMDSYTLILTGGVFKPEEFSFVGDIAIDNLSKFNVDTALISASGVSISHGLTDSRLDEIQIQRKMIEVAQVSALLVDSSKFETASLMKLCDFDDIDMLITDSQLGSDIFNKYRDLNINLILANEV